MIRGIFGKTGGGKTLTLVEQLIQTLLHTERTVATNLEELLIPRLNEYLQERQDEQKRKHPARPVHPVDLSRRLVVIPKAETRHFYRYRSGGLVLPPFQEADANGKKIPLDEFNAKIEPYFLPIWNTPQTLVGVDYFLSECHRYFPAREFQQFGRVVNFWATQNRHFDDNAWLESQFPAQIDSNFRELAVEWYHVRNRGNEVFGRFRQRAGIQWRMYYDLPRRDNVQPDDDGEKQIDVKGVASCYKTRGAVSSAMADSSTETKPKNNKLPFWVFPALVFAGIILIGIGIMYVPVLARKGVSAAVGSMANATAGGVEDALASSAPGQPPRDRKAQAQSQVHDVQASSSVQPSPALVGNRERELLYPLSVTRRGLTALVTLSDGTRRWYDPRYPAQSDGIEAITPAYVQIDGEKLYFRSPVSLPAPRAGVQSSALVPPPINLDLPPIDAPPVRLPMPQSAPADASPGTGLPPGTFAPSRL